MGTASENLQIKLIEQQSEVQIRSEFEAAWLLVARNRLGKELNAQEQASVIEEVNKVIFRRRQLLEDLRKKKKLAVQPYTTKNEIEINTIVDNLLRTNPDYEAPETTVDPSDANSPMMGLKDIFKKFTGALGPIGQLFEKLFEFILPMIDAFTGMGEKLTPKKTPANLVNEGKLEDADVLLGKQEADLLSKMDSVLLEMAGSPGVPALQTELNAYRATLDSYKNEDLLGRANKQYKTDNLSVRMRLFEAYSSKANEIISAHDKKVAADKKIENVNKQVTDLTGKCNAAPLNTPERSYLATRLGGLQAELSKQRKDQAQILGTEKTLLTQMTGQVRPKRISNENAHRPSLTAEKGRLGLP